MAEWGRKQYAKPWPSRTHVWTWGAFFLSCLFFVFMVWRDGRVTLAEVLALRTLFLNLQFRQTQGPLTEAEMRGLIERADALKGERARERIEAARSQARKQAGVPAEKSEAGEPQTEEV